MKHIYVVISLALAGLAGAQQPRRVTFNEAVSIALKQNIDVRQAQNAASLSSAAVQQQKMNFLPNLSLNVSGSNNVGRNFSQSEGTIIDQQTQSLSTGISTGVTLFDGMKNVSQLRAARAGEEAGEQDLARARQTAVFTVASNFVSLVNAQEQLRVQRENLASLESQEKQIQAYVDAGTRPIADLYQQQATVASARAQVTSASRTVELAKVDLIQTLQLDPAGAYEFVAPVVDTAIVNRPQSLDTLIARAYAHRSDLDAQESRLDAAAQDVKAAGAGRLPTVSLNASYNTAYTSANDLPISSQLDQRRGGGIGIGVSFPLFDRGATSLAQQRAEIAEDNARLAVTRQKQSIALEVRRAYLDQQSAREQLAAATAQLAAAQKAVEATQARYQVGASTLVEVTQARAQQVQAASAVLSARYNLVLQQSVMAYYTGELDPATLTLGS
jgi:outer membrane protein